MSDINWDEAPTNCVGHSISSCFRGYWQLDNGVMIAAPDFGLKAVKHTPRPEAHQEIDDIGVSCFDLMFHGCQDINAPQAVEILDAIKAGKIHNVTWSK